MTSANSVVQSTCLTVALMTKAIKTKKLASGELAASTVEGTKVILSAKQGTNADLFPDVLSLYARPDARVLDMTYGKGVFWRLVERERYKVITADLIEQSDVRCDFRQAPFAASTFDLVVLDPPYMRTNNSKPQMGANYQNRAINLRTHQQVLDLYIAGMAEARRLLKPSGVLVIKCQDEVMSGKQQWTHVELMQQPDWLVEDLFVLVRNGQPLANWTRQLHARKNHSYFIVLRKQ